MTQPLSNTPVPAPIKHAHKVWELLLDASKLETVEIPLSDDKIEALVYRGRIGDIFNEAGVSKTYYSVVRRILLDCGAMTILYRGTIHAPSVVVLDPSNPPPDVAVLNVKSDEERLTSEQKFDTLTERVQALERRLGEVNLTEALRNHEGRISGLESSKGVGESS